MPAYIRKNQRFSRETINRLRFSGKKISSPAAAAPILKGIIVYPVPYNGLIANNATTEPTGRIHLYATAEGEVQIARCYTLVPNEILPVGLEVTVIQSGETWIYNENGEDVVYPVYYITEGVPDRYTVVLQTEIENDGSVNPFDLTSTALIENQVVQVSGRMIPSGKKAVTTSAYMASRQVIAGDAENEPAYELVLVGGSCLQELE